METKIENMTYVAPEVKTIEVRLTSRIMQTSGNIESLDGQDTGYW